MEREVSFWNRVVSLSEVKPGTVVRYVDRNASEHCSQFGHVVRFTIISSGSFSTPLSEEKLGVYVQFSCTDKPEKMQFNQLELI